MIHVPSDGKRTDYAEVERIEKTGGWRVEKPEPPTQSGNTMKRMGVSTGDGLKTKESGIT